PDLLPLRSVITASVSLPVGLIIVLLADTWFGEASVMSLMILPIMVMQIMFLSGIAWVLSLLTLVMRDIQQILQYVTIMLLIVTPIAYTPDMIPEKMQLFVYLNPLYYFTAGFQYVLSYDSLPPFIVMAGMIVLSLGSFCGGYWAFQKAKTKFYDYI